MSREVGAQALPVFKKFVLMQGRPPDDHRHGPTGQVALQNDDRIDAYLCLRLSIQRVKVGWRMIVVVHANDDTEKAAQFRPNSLTSHNAFVLHASIIRGSGSST
jgi:hypothetical protein